MATTRRFLRPCSSLCTPPRLKAQHATQHLGKSHLTSPQPLHTRGFLSALNLDLWSPQVLTVSRTLPYASNRLFALIADVDSYSQFVPYCTRSQVTQWTDAGTYRAGEIADVEHPESIGVAQQKRLPSEAVLHVGWGAVQEAYTSRLTCDPVAGIVEARSGADAGFDGSGSSSAARGIFKCLVTRWTIKPLSLATSAPSAGAGGGGLRAMSAHHGSSGGNWSSVDLYIRFQLVNKYYAALSRAVSAQVASTMIEAFEKQARRRLSQV